MKQHLTRIDAVAFDYGGVLSLPQDESCVERLAKLTRLQRSEFESNYRRNRLAYDRNLLSSRDYWATVVVDPDLLLTDQLLDELIRVDVASWLQVDDRVLAWARKLKAAHIAIAILSNMPRDVLTGLRNSWGDWFAEFSVTIFSCEVGTVKPEPDIYQRLVDALVVDGSRTLFIDDHDANVNGAMRAGLHAIHYESYEGLNREIPARFELPSHDSSSAHA